ncbi:hypothetical protein B0A49_11833 [Cryomyces minteri]|uniref:SET domain-containing protein n=1 Tax=Cryomyces minteri TaxID=331657 RepID=A0A4U0WHP0_9PEZI|nr:hypothetical protein B0A49_11833 [Cryomyces minteri]
MKAYYRIAFALWKCGGGALRSALEVLRLAQGAGWDEDTEQFNALGNRILLDVEKVLKEEDGVTRQLVRMGRLEANARSKERWELQGVRGLLRTRYTSIKKERYPWDEHESIAAVPGSMEALNESQSYMTENCEIKAVSQEMGKTVRYFMVAKEDIYPGDILVEEKSPFHVTTSPEGHEGSLHCDACAACLEVPKCILERTYSNTPSIPDSDEATLGSSSRDDLGTSDGEVAEYIRTPPGQKDGVASSIETETDRDIALLANKNPPPPGLRREPQSQVPKPSLQVLEGLMLLRFLACARVDEINPLALSSMRLLDGELGPARHIPNDKSMEKDVAMTDCHGYDDLNCLTAQKEGQSVENDDQRIPWSYFSNVVRPLSCLLDMGRVEAALDIKNYDGWILNTMIAKIHANLRCTTQPRWHKKYDEDGLLIGCRPISRQVKPKPPCFGTPEDRGICSDSARLEGVWVGSVHPLCSTLQVAGPDERPNAELYEIAGTIFCVPIVSTSPSLPPIDSVGTLDSDSTQDLWGPRPCIKAGERILLATRNVELRDPAFLGQTTAPEDERKDTGVSIAEAKTSQSAGDDVAHSTSNNVSGTDVDMTDADDDSEF